MFFWCEKYILVDIMPGMYRPQGPAPTSDFVDSVSGNRERHYQHFTTRYGRGKTQSQHQAVSVLTG